MLSHFIQALFKTGLAGIPHGNGHVAKQSPLLASFEGTLPEPRREFVLSEMVKFFQIRVEESFARPVCHFRTSRSLGIPGTHILANVAAKNVIANSFAHIFGNGRFQFNCQVRNALSGVHHTGLYNGPSGATFHTARAGAAAVGHGAVGQQVQIKKNLPNKKIGTLVLVNQTAIFSKPAESCLVSPDPIARRPGIHVSAVFQTLEAVL